MLLQRKFEAEKLVPIIFSLRDAVTTRFHHLVQKQLVCYLSFDSSADTNVHSTLGQSSWRVKSQLKKRKICSDKGLVSYNNDYLFKSVNMHQSFIRKQTLVYVLLRYLLLNGKSCGGGGWGGVALTQVRICDFTTRFRVHFLP